MPDSRRIDISFATCGTVSPSRVAISPTVKGSLRDSTAMLRTHRSPYSSTAVIFIWSLSLEPLFEAVPHHCTNNIQDSQVYSFSRIVRINKFLRHNTLHLCLFE